MISPVDLTVDLNALVHNLEQLRTLATTSRVMAILKGNAYGHGLIPCASVLHQADGFGVSYYQEALALRQAAIKKRIVLLQGFLSSQELLLLSELQCEVVLHHFVHLELLESIKLNKPIIVWVKINTGMNRLGFSLSDVLGVYERLLLCDNVIKPIHFMSHLSSANYLAHKTVNWQWQQFNSVTKGLSGPRSLAKSAAIIAYPQTQCDWVRAGIALYGVSPFAGKTAASHGLKAVMSLRSRLISVRFQRKGDVIGYGNGYVCPENMPVGVVAIGYCHGYPASAISGTPILIDNHRCCVIAAINMSMLTVDLRSCPSAKVGSRVTLWGEDLPVENVASFIKASPYALLTGINHRSLNVNFIH